MVENRPQVPHFDRSPTESTEHSQVPEETIQERRQLLSSLKDNFITLFNKYRPERDAKERREHMREFRQGVRSEVLHISFLGTENEKIEYLFRYDTTGYTIHTSENASYVWTNGENTALTEENSLLRNVEKDELKVIIELTEYVSSTKDVEITYSTDKVT